MRFFCVLGVASILGASGCNLQQLLDPTADAGTPDTGTTEAGATAASPQGANCTDVGGGNTLCQFISSCPNNSLSTSLFPHCGFRIHGDALDLECWCVDSICPVGTATSCAQLASTIGDQTEDTVCAKVATGGCASLTGDGGGGTSGGNASCNPSCTDGCGNTPECAQACGC